MVFIYIYMEWHVPQKPDTFSEGLNNVRVNNMATTSKRDYRVANEVKEQIKDEVS